MKIKELKKNDWFSFNKTVFIVIRKFISDDKPLIAMRNHHIYEEHRFHNEDLEVQREPKQTLKL